MQIFFGAASSRLRFTIFKKNMNKNLQCNNTSLIIANKDSRYLAQKTSLALLHTSSLTPLDP
jgi:hypothetical protein